MKTIMNAFQNIITLSGLVTKIWLHKNYYFESTIIIPLIYSLHGFLKVSQIMKRRGTRKQNN